MITTAVSAIDDYTFVSGQITPQDIVELSEAGFRHLVNHRPDDEEPGQPSAAMIAQAAEAAGLSFMHIPVRGLPDEAAVAATARALRSAAPGEKILMFCRSGMRSSAAWAMARRSEGASPDDLRARAAAAGYDLARVPL